MLLWFDSLHGRLAISTVTAVRVTCLVRVTITIVVIVKVWTTSVGRGLCSCFCNVAIKLFGLAATNGVCDESNEEGKTDKTNDGENTSYSALVLEEAVNGTSEQSQGDWGDVIAETE